MTETCPTCASGAYEDGVCSACGYGMVIRLKRKKKAKPVPIPSKPSDEYREPWWSK